jgi:hypothetical protein
MIYFLFNNPGETAMLISYKKKEFGTTCFYNTYIYIYHGLENKADLADYFNQKMEGHEQKRELLMKKTTTPSPGSLILNQRKKGDKKRTPEASQLLI